MDGLRSRWKLQSNEVAGVRAATTQNKVSELTNKRIIVPVISSIGYWKARVIQQIRGVRSLIVKDQNSPTTSALRNSTAMSLYCEASTPMLKLDGKNYEQWRIAFDLWLDNNNRRRTIYNAGNETSDDITQEDINTLKGQLLAFMLPFDIFKLVKRKANAKEIINELERLYNKRKNEYAAELAMDELTKLRHTQLGNLNQFIIDFKTQLVNCEDNGSNFSDEKKIEYFIRSMPTELDYATTNVQISGLSIFEDVLDLMRFADSLQFRRQKEDSSLGEINRVLPANSNQPCQHRDDHQNQDNRRSPERYSRRPSRSRSRSREHSRESLCSRYDYYDDYPRCRSRERSWESSCGSRHEYDYDDRSRSANRRGYYSRY